MKIVSFVNLNGGFKIVILFLFVNIFITFADGLYIPDVALKLIFGVVADV